MKTGQYFSGARWGLWLVSLGWWASLGSADVIHLKDGETLQGKILKRTASEIVVQFDFGTMSFTPDEILAVEAESPPADDVTEGAARPDEEAPRPPTGDVLTATPPEATPTSPAASAPQDVEPLRPGAVGAVLPEAMKAVAYIATLRKDGRVSFGSGTVINASGVMVTNYHVVAEAKKVAVLMPGSDAKIKLGRARPYEARVVKTDPCFDLALVTAPVKTPSYLRFAEDEASIQVGDEVRAIGNPQGLAISVSRGIISAVRTVKELGAEQLSVGECAHLSERMLEATSFIQTDAAINPGNSGGPLLNAQNEIVGINTFIFTESGGSIGLNFALHVQHVKKFVGSYAKR